MPYCKKCFYKIGENSKFCPNCGEKVEVIIEQNVVEKSDLKPEKKCWKIFGNTSFILGIIGLATCLLLGGLYLGEFGIVFGALGLRSKENKSKAKSGLIMNIVSLALAFVILFIYIALVIAGIIVVAENHGNYSN